MPVEKRTSGYVRITHRPTGLLLAEGPLGWGITPFEGNYYISKKYLHTNRFKPNFTPGLCPYKFLYVWVDLLLENGNKEKNLGWMYWLPNPLLPFIWFHVALPGSHPSLIVERSDLGMMQSLPSNGALRNDEKRDRL